MAISQDVGSSTNNADPIIRFEFVNEEAPPIVFKANFWWTGKDTFKVLRAAIDWGPATKFEFPLRKLPWFYYIFLKNK